jgi:NADH-quinone oxidoreductase subunit L
MTESEAKAAHAHDDDHHHNELDKSHKPKEVPVVMWLPLVVLAVFSLGWFGWWLETGHLLEHWLFPSAGHGEEKKALAVDYWTLVAISGATSVGGILLGLALYANGLPKKEGDYKHWNPVRLAARDQWGIDAFFTNLIGLRIGGALGNVLKAFDEYVVDGLVKGFGYLSGIFGSIFRKVQTGKVREYALMMSLGSAALIGWLLYVLTTRSGN